MRQVRKEYRREREIGRCKKGRPDAIEEHKIDGIAATEHANHCEGLAQGPC